MSKTNFGDIITAQHKLEYMIRIVNNAAIDFKHFFSDIHFFISPQLKENILKLNIESQLWQSLVYDGRFNQSDYISEDD